MTATAPLCRQNSLYMAEDLSFGEMHLDEDEFLSVERLSLKDALDMVMEGKIRDGKTQIAILKAAQIKKIH